MTTWKTSGAAKIERAKKHFGELEAATAAFEKRNPYGPVRDEKEGPGTLVFRARITELPRLELGAIAGDVIHNLRSALDILWRQAMYPQSGAKSGSDVRKVSFPFLRSAKEYETRTKREKKGRRQDAVKLVQSLKPYKGGNDPLWWVHVLDIADKHHVLIPIVVAVQHDHTSYAFKWAHLDKPQMFTVPYKTDRARVVKDGAEIFRLRMAFSEGSSAQVDMEAQFTFEITLGELEAAEGEPLLGALNKSVSAVEEAVEKFLTAGLVG